MNVIKKLNEATQYYNQTYNINIKKKQLKVLENKNELIEETFDRAEGCTTTACIKAIEYAINNQRSTVVLSVPSANTKNLIHNRLIDMLQSNTLKRHVLSITKNPYNINLLNGSRILIINNIGATRGQAIDCLIVDGVRYFSNDDLESAIYCTVRSNHRQVVLLNQTDLICGQHVNI